MTGKRTFTAIVAAVALFAALPSLATAGVITTGGYADNIDTGGVSYELSVTQDNVGDLTYMGKLTNTSPTPNAPLIDAFFFGVDPDAVIASDNTLTDGDVFFENIAPIWEFSTTSVGVQFDYVGARSTPGTRLGVGDMLTFDILFSQAYHDANTDLGQFQMFVLEEGFNGAGAGGGQDIKGQVGVSFQQLGADGEDSQLVVSDWVGGIDGDGGDGVVPEPSSMAMFATGGLLLLFPRRRRRK